MQFAKSGERQRKAAVMEHLEKGSIMNNRINTDVLVADLKNVVRDSEQLLEAVAAATGDEAQQLRERLNETLEKARQTCKGLENKTKESLKAADEVIREHPYQSIGVALAIGLLAGVALAKAK
jgi:ElaB/YqjD/DUF883 family membrane-anchored ribosome-binding protein